jgi:hypothetical protein
MSRPTREGVKVGHQVKSRPTREGVKVGHHVKSRLIIR